MEKEAEIVQGQAKMKAIAQIKVRWKSVVRRLILVQVTLDDPTGSLQLPPAGTAIGTAPLEGPNQW